MAHTAPMKNYNFHNVHFRILPIFIPFHNQPVLHISCSVSSPLFFPFCRVHIFLRSHTLTQYDLCVKIEYVAAINRPTNREMYENMCVLLVSNPSIQAMQPLSDMATKFTEAPSPDQLLCLASCTHHYLLDTQTVPLYLLIP